MAKTAKRADEPSCPKCGRTRSAWKEDGFPMSEQTYCCEGCAHDTGCQCESAGAQESPRAGRHRGLGGAASA